MVRREEAKISALVYVAAATVLFCLFSPAEWGGLHPDSSLAGRLGYPLMHSTWLHLAVNCWALLSIVFLYDISLPMLLSAYAVAVSYPIGHLAFLYHAPILPTVGASGICYALLGRYSLSVEKKLRYSAWVLSFIAVGFFFPQSNAWLHLYCYLCGTLLAALNKPYKHNVKRDGESRS